MNELLLKVEVVCRKLPTPSSQVAKTRFLSLFVVVVVDSSFLTFAKVQLLLRWRKIYDIIFLPFNRCPKAVMKSSTCASVSMSTMKRTGSKAEVLKQVQRPLNLPQIFLHTIKSILHSRHSPPPHLPNYPLNPQFTWISLRSLSFPPSD